MTNKFDINIYFTLIDKIISDILLKPQKDKITFDILDISKHNKLIILKEKQLQMNIGKIWQEIIGNYDGFINLKSHHNTGLDIISYEKKIIIELKNRTNTDNSSSKKTNLEKLANFKKQHLDYTCIYATINANTEQQTYNNNIKKLLIQNLEIENHTVYKFLKFIYNNDNDIIIYYI